MDTPSLRAVLARLASNHRWSWRPSLAAAFATLPTAAPGRHPYDAVTRLTDAQLEELVGDPVFVGTVGGEAAALDEVVSDAVVEPQVVYYSPEFGISDLVPQYSGGLGILAGDHLKAASDVGLQLAAVGLLYREGFFRQELRDGGQAERYESYDPATFGMALTDITVDVPMANRTVTAAVWRLDVGRIPLLLLDTDVATNSPDDRAITNRLYSGDRRHRLEQEMVLGVGGARAVAEMGWDPAVHHLNEGHAGFLALELIDRARNDGAMTLDEAVARVKPHLLFTTHTPVPAGIDRFDHALIEPHLGPWAQRWGDTPADLLALGRDPDDGTVFNMAALCLGLAARANGVSKLHGEVSRELFARVAGGDRITSITNGVHARTWVSPALQRCFDRRLPAGWENGEPHAWEHVGEISDDELRDVRIDTRSSLVALLEARAGASLEPDALVVGFARRFATYKRATLLLRHRELLEGLLGDDHRPLHLVFAGKAHPADEPGKALLATIVEHSRSKAAHCRLTFLPDYDIAVARMLYQGADVWLNNPRRPQEACGTSGEKAALNGAVNCSIRDGWWAEMSDGRNGFDIATSALTDVDARDDEESASALAALASIAAEFHADGRGVPSAAWLERVRHNWRTLGPRVTSARMVRDYQRELYQPLADAVSRTG